MTPLLHPSTPSLTPTPTPSIFDRPDPWNEPPKGQRIHLAERQLRQCLAREQLGQPIVVGPFERPGLPCIRVCAQRAPSGRHLGYQVSLEDAPHAAGHRGRVLERRQVANLALLPDWMARPAQVRAAEHTPDLHGIVLAARALAGQAVN